MVEHLGISPGGQVGCWVDGAPLIEQEGAEVADAQIAVSLPHAGATVAAKAPRLNEENAIRQSNLMSFMRVSSIKDDAYFEYPKQAGEFGRYSWVNLSPGTA
jgi:hypothetical protein